MGLLWCWLDIESKSYLCAWGSYACNHSSISKFGFQWWSVLAHVNLIPLPYHTANQQGCGIGKCRTYITAWFGVVMRNAQPYSLCLHLAAAAAALHGRISNHVLVASASFLLDQVNRGSILIAAFSIKLRWYWWILKPVLRLVMCTFKVCLC